MMEVGNLGSKLDLSLLMAALGDFIAFNDDLPTFCAYAARPFLAIKIVNNQLLHTRNISEHQRNARIIGQFAGTFVKPEPTNLAEIMQARETVYTIVRNTIPPINDINFLIIFIIQELKRVPQGAEIDNDLARTVRPNLPPNINVLMQKFDSILT